MEEWRPINGFERYLVSSLGRIRGPRGIMKGGNCKGYRAVGIYIGRKRYHKTVHSIVAAAFIGPRPDGYEVNHKDLDKTNNASTNLEYLTSSGNKQHAIARGAAFIGTHNHSTKLTEDQAREIRRIYKPWEYGSHRLAKRFGVTKAAICAILTGASWPWVV